MLGPSCKRSAATWSKGVYRATELKATADESDLLLDPKGKKTVYLQNFTGYSQDWGEPSHFENLEFCTEIVEGDNGDVYISNPVGYAMTLGYLKGKKDGNRIKVELPQPVLLYSYTVDNVNLMERVNSDVTDTESFAIVKDASKNFVEYEFSDNGTFKMIIPENCILGITYNRSNPETNNTWSCEGAIASTFRPLDMNVLVTVPETAQRVDGWVYDSDGMPVDISMAMEGDNIWITPFCQDERPDCWIKGTIKDDVVTFASGQLMKVPEPDWYLEFFHAAYRDSEKRKLVLLPSATFNFDREKNTLTCSESTPYLVDNSQQTELNWLFRVEKPVYSKPTYAVGTPINPEITSGESNEYGFFVDFLTQCTTTDGEFMRVNDSYYNIFIDGVPYKVNDGTLDSYDVPFAYSNNEKHPEADMGISGNALSAEKYIVLRPASGLTGISSMGLQSCCRYGDIVNKSDIVTYDYKTGSIVTTTNVPATAISLSDESVTIEVGGSKKLTATAEPAETTDYVFWSSSDESVATVKDGVVTALAVGESTITAKCGNFTASCNVAVGNGGVDSITFGEGPVEIWNMQGVRILESENRNDISKLATGIYILCQGNKVNKIIVK